MLTTNAFTFLRDKLIIDQTARSHLPSIGALFDFPREGGLMDYGVAIDFVGQYRQAASYVDRIFKGEKPGDLPGQGPTKYRLVINLKTARAFGLTIPETLLATADEVIQ